MAIILYKKYYDIIITVILWDKRGKWKTVGLSFLMEMLVLYIFCLFNKLTTGITVIYIASALILICAMEIMLKKKFFDLILFKRNFHL